MSKVVKVYKAKLVKYTTASSSLDKEKNVVKPYVPQEPERDQRISKTEFPQKFRDIATDLWIQIYGADKLTEQVEPLEEFLDFFRKVTVTKVDDKHYRIDGLFNKRFVYDVSRYIKKGSKLLKVFDIITESKLLFLKKTYVIIHTFFIPELYALLLDLYAKTHRSFYAEAAVRIKNSTWLKQAEHPVIKTKLDWNRLKDIKWELKPFQKEFIEQYPIKKDSYQLRGFILAFDQGLGKTFTSLVLMYLLRKDLVVIFCPKTLMFNWKNEIQSIFKKPPKDNEIFLVGESPASHLKTAKYIIANYERVGEVTQLLSRLNKKHVGLIVDESQNFRNIKAKRTQELVNLIRTHGKIINDVLLLSGTPIKSNYAELAPYLYILDPRFDDEALKIWLKVFNVDESIASDVIRYRFSIISHRKLKTEVLKLPEKKYIEVPASVPNADEYTLENFKKLVKENVTKKFQEYQANFDKYYTEFLNLLETIKQLAKQHGKQDLVQKINYYESYVKQTEKGILFEKILNQEIVNQLREIEHEIESFLSSIKKHDLKKKFRKLKTLVTRITYKVYGEVLGDLLHSLRAKMVYEIFSYNIQKVCKIIEDSSKTVIFTYVTEVIPKLKKLIEEKCGIKVVTITGATKDRGSVVKKFKTDSDVKVLIASYQVAAVGLTLTEADTMIYADKPYREADLKQAEDRIYRIGQDKPVKIIYLKLKSSKPTIQDRIDEIVKYFGTIVKLAIEKNL